MDKIGIFPFYGLAFAKDGSLVDAAQKAALLHALDDQGPTDLLVMSHGWNNDMAEARGLYDLLFSNLCRSFDRTPPPERRRYAIAGLFWPSKRFADADLISGGSAASFDDDGTLAAADLRRQLADLKGAFDGPDDELDSAAQVVDRLESDPEARKCFAASIRSLLPPRPSDTADDASDVFFDLSSEDLFARFEGAVLDQPVAGDSGGVADLGDDSGGTADLGSTAGLGDIWTGAKATARRILNYATYYQMKERAGRVGGGLNALLGEVKASRPGLRLHLIGHSFGARLVTAAVDGSMALDPASLSLLQGAFSHNGFTPRFDGMTDGFFRNVVAGRKVGGPIAITHTVNDKAVGLAYPLASRLVNDNRRAIGDENDVFGGMGRNGAVRMPGEECTAMTLLAPDGTYAFASGRVHNLRADDFIASHGDVGNAAVANMLSYAVTAPARRS